MKSEKLVKDDDFYKLLYDFDTAKVECEKLKEDNNKLK